jgi:hypothetical protein
VITERHCCDPEGEIERDAVRTRSPRMDEGIGEHAKPGRVL